MTEQIVIFFQIVFIDLVLAGDNAIIIGMVASQFPAEQRKKIIFWGIGAAIVLRILFTLATAYLLQISGLRLIGGILLLYICYKLYVDVVKHNEKSEDIANLKIASDAELIILPNNNLERPNYKISRYREDNDEFASKSSFEISTEEKETLWGFIKRYQSKATPETHPDLDQAVGFAVAFYNDFVKPNKIYREASEVEREAILDLRDKLANYNGDLDAESLQSVVFSCGRERFDPLRKWFQALYEVLLGASQGPRFGGFIALYGIEETIALIDSALEGKFL